MVVKTIEQLDKKLALISQRIKKLEKKMVKVEYNAIIEVKGKNKEGDFILGKKKPMMLK